jgi:hypothetical protein
MGLLTPQGPPMWHPASPVLKQCCREAVHLCASQGVGKYHISLVEVRPLFLEFLTLVSSRVGTT